MPSRSALLRKLDKTLFVIRREDPPSPASTDLDPYGNRIDVPIPGDSATESCWCGAYEFVPTAGGSLEPDASNRVAIQWAIDLDPEADVRPSDVIVERADPDDPTSAELHRFEPTIVDLVTGFDGTPSHWEIRAVEYV